jgi:hypothetical protein
MLHCLYRVKIFLVENNLEASAKKCQMSEKQAGDISVKVVII